MLKVIVLGGLLLAPSIGNATCYYDNYNSPYHHQCLDEDSGAPPIPQFNLPQFNTVTTPNGTTNCVTTQLGNQTTTTCN